LIQPVLSAKLLYSRTAVRPAGWQNHPVSNSRFHFIIPAESTLEDPSSLMALVEGKYSGIIPSSTRWEPPAQAEGAGGEDVYNAAESVFESKDHLLHGMLHLNGYGHLLRMNGAQGGSRTLIGAHGGMRAIGDVGTSVDGVVVVVGRGCQGWWAACLVLVMCGGRRVCLRAVHARVSGLPPAQKRCKRLLHSVLQLWCVLTLCARAWLVVLCL
jgi:hypothetical protein